MRERRGSVRCAIGRSERAPGVAAIGAGLPFVGNVAVIYGRNRLGKADIIPGTNRRIAFDVTGGNTVQRNRHRQGRLAGAGNGILGADRDTKIPLIAAGRRRGITGACFAGNICIVRIIIGAFLPLIANRAVTGRRRRAGQGCGRFAGADRLIRVDATRGGNVVDLDQDIIAGSRTSYRIGADGAGGYKAIPGIVVQCARRVPGGAVSAANRAERHAIGAGVPLV